jgi:hypothetical protein
MDDDQVFSLFVMVACMATLIMPPVAQPMFAVFAAGLALATRFVPAEAQPGTRPERDQHHVAGD